MTIEQRFWSKVNMGSGEQDCWLWTANLFTTGYGMFDETHNRKRGAHQVAYELSVGRIAKGMHIDHLCRNRKCVNPAHLEVVTPAENTRRGRAAKLRPFLENIKHLHRSGITQANLGTLYGVRQSTISRVVTGRRWRQDNG